MFSEQPDAGAGAANHGDASAFASPRRLGWANLLARVFAVDVTHASARPQLGHDAVLGDKGPVSIRALFAPAHR